MDSASNTPFWKLLQLQNQQPRMQRANRENNQSLWAKYRTRYAPENIHCR